MSIAIRFLRDSYVDSVLQLGATRAMRELPGVQWAGAAMATPANLDTLRAEGVDENALSGAGSNDFFLVVRADDESIAGQALQAGQSAAVSPSSGRRPGVGDTESPRPRSLRDALDAQPDSDVAVVSVPGEYATLAAFQALSTGLHVLLFSDNVDVADEIALKDFAARRGLLMIGPGAGTAVLGGTGLGFANAVPADRIGSVGSVGSVGIVAAAGTGAQEAMALLARWGVGISQVIGLGGRDLSAALGGRMAATAITALREDPGTDVILLISKPPAPDVAAAVLSLAGRTPLVAGLIGLDPATPAPPAVVLADTLEGAALATLRVLGRDAPEHTRTHGPSVAQARDRLPPGRRLIRGLFSGGTLCYEPLVILGRTIGEVRSNTPIIPAWGLPAPAGSHQCLDLGEQEYTRGGHIR
jgi:FdrA protein